MTFAGNVVTRRKCSHNSRLASISYLVYSSIDFNGNNEISITNGLERKGTVINTSERGKKIGNFSKKKACLDQYFDNWGKQFRRVLAYALGP